ncbi:aromatic-ring-hydroxylating dioxygenase subunit beta [Acinetobacter johnsonii]|uniref:aromatic-ring-hydroxylating dioxygenase subunit beta n=1 Tax=Acinetobacter johnsonii TaxID=40214 RepID=UPI0024468DDC|nr:aromatic-ring-hydroxylating dioxygenase subunit beta [Acinetobacter johnsonii]MDH1699645.1 aromatic-ring-hydroxylating dioxygenase subunit beta [Acinetobacter johnsonii]
MSDINVAKINGNLEEITRSQIEDFLYLEAHLLDEWDLHGWHDLFTEDATYLVPSTDLSKDTSPDNALFYIADDAIRLKERVIRLLKRTAHSEYPRSRTRHFVTNVRLLGLNDGVLSVSAAYTTYRIKGNTDVYVGVNYYKLKIVEGSIKILEKRSVLDLENLRPHGRVSIIL